MQLYFEKKTSLAKVFLHLKYVYSFVCPTVNSAAAAGGPGGPIGPGRPRRPLRPPSPFSPLMVRKSKPWSDTREGPGGPRSPFCPRGPAAPSSPAGPPSPFGPAGPCNKNTLEPLVQANIAIIVTTKITEIIRSY